MFLPGVPLFPPLVLSPMLLPALPLRSLEGVIHLVLRLRPVPLVPPSCEGWSPWLSTADVWTSWAAGTS